MKGHMGKILRVNLTERKISTIETSKYQKWYGGHGMGSAIFWDLCKDKAISGFDPRNVITIMTSPLTGTLVPAGSGRCEVQAIGLESYPIEWFTRSNFGGRFSSQLKYAGWDGIAIEGKADKPVWIDIRDDQVTIRDAAGLWGLDTWTTQKRIWHEVTGEAVLNDWWDLGGRKTTQRPAVLTIGPAGENLTRVASLVHDAGNGAGEGGLGGVWGSKNLKAVSVIGTGSVEVADPNALMEARIWARDYGINVDDYKPVVGNFPFAGNPNIAALPKGMKSRPQGCTGCHRCCRGRTETGMANESHCMEHQYYGIYDIKKHGQITETNLRAADLCQQYGINVWQIMSMLRWLNILVGKGLAGPGKQIDTNLPFQDLGEAEFLEEFIRRISYKEEIGAYLAEGLARAAKKLGRLEEDIKSGALSLQYWGHPQHYDARTEVEWGYGSILGERDVNEHDFNWCCYWTPTVCSMYGVQPPVTAKELSEIMAEKLKPYCDPMMIDYSDEGIYSGAMAKTVAWHRHYTRFWKESMGLCDFAWSDLLNPYGPNNRGLTPDGEVRFFRAVTGQDLSFEESLEVGRKMWNLDRAIWILQGRHRDQEYLGAYSYEQPAVPGYTNFEVPYTMTVYENGEWKYKSVAGRILDKTKFDEWKTRYYDLEGWDSETGWPTRKTLEDLNLKYVADELGKNGKLGE